jgi:hypothetical protein
MISRRPIALERTGVRTIIDPARKSLKRRQDMRTALSGFHGAGSTIKPHHISSFCSGKTSFAHDVTPFAGVDT